MITRDNYNLILKELKQDKKFIKKLKSSDCMEYCLLELSSYGDLTYKFTFDINEEIQESIDNGNACFEVEVIARDLNIDIY